MMELQIIKNTTKQHIVKYIRDDGSDTWMLADDYFVQHDLSHFAIENTLKYSSAFMGMLNAGMDIKDFENRERRIELGITKEAAYAESMANLFLMETIQGNFESFNRVSQEVFKTSFSQFDPPELSDIQIENIRTYLRHLLNLWHDLPPGEKFILTIDL
jgi:hypothetical protein